ncbi:MAG: hypothetical protein NTV80_23425 [Verrucomicrobia bacterium]|nr:hypothetical protein [Verrucomicrobiota bacterium]
MPWTCLAAQDRLHPLVKDITPIGYVSQSSAVDGWLTYTDASAMPHAGNLNRSVWYAVTAIHETPLDFYFSSPHAKVQSAPSAPAFGIFRDREGPVAPVGFINVNCGKLVTRFVNSTTAVRSSPAAASKAVHIRATCRRTKADIQGVKFRFLSGRGLSAVELYSSPILPFPGSDTVVYETQLFESQTTALTVECIAYAPDGCASIAGESDTTNLNAAETLWQVRNFEAGRYSATDFVPGKVLEPLGTELSFISQSATGPDAVRGLLVSAAYNGRTVVVQEFNTLLFGWIIRGVSQVRGNEVVFPDPGRSVMDGLFPSYRAILLPTGGDCVCLHDARPKGSSKIIPISISTNVPATTREWRLYRRVDEGDMALVKSLVIDPGAFAPEQLLAEDSNLPPHGAVVAYYAQCFDSNHNPSPFVFLGKIKLIPDPTKPLMNAPIALDAVANMGRLKVKWFCPPPGIQRFRIYVLPLKSDSPHASAVDPSITTINITPSPNGIIIPQYFQLIGETESRSLQALRYFETADIPPGTSSPLREVEFEVTPGVDYAVFVACLGLDLSTFLQSDAHLFTWKAPPPVVAETLVAWPARPLPEVVKVSGVDAFLMSSAIALPNYLANNSTIPDAVAASMYPVGISLGYMFVLPLPITHDAADPMCASHPFVFGLMTPAGAGNPSDVLPTSLGNDPTSYLVPDVLPCALFRQTLLNAEDPGPLMQVSPLRVSIAHRVDPTPAPLQEVLGNGQLTTIADPFIKANTYSGTLPPLTILSLVDTHPVEEGASYRYYLVSYRDDGEIRRVIDCGNVTIPETP